MGRRLNSSGALTEESSSHTSGYSSIKTSNPTGNAPHILLAFLDAPPDTVAVVRVEIRLDTVVLIIDPPACDHPTSLRANR